MAQTLEGEEAGGMRGFRGELLLRLSAVLIHPWTGHPKGCTRPRWVHWGGVARSVGRAVVPPTRRCRKVGVGGSRENGSNPYVCRKVIPDFRAYANRFCPPPPPAQAWPQSQTSRQNSGSTPTPVVRQARACARHTHNSKARVRDNHAGNGNIGQGQTSQIQTNRVGLRCVVRCCDAQTPQSQT